MRESRGRSSETFLRLCSRAPRTMRRSATPVRTFLERSGGTEPLSQGMGGATAVSEAFDSERIARTFDLRPPFPSFTRMSGEARLGRMIDHAHDLGAVREATERLLDAVGKLDN